jgi:hypothetical protein
MAKWWQSGYDYAKKREQESFSEFRADIINT